LCNLGLGGDRWVKKEKWVSKEQETRIRTYSEIRVSTISLLYLSSSSSSTSIALSDISL